MPKKEMTKKQLKIQAVPVMEFSHVPSYTVDVYSGTMFLQLNKSMDV
jgi:hypothetical protein